MVKGASIKFVSYAESIPKILNLMNLQTELKKYDKIILKPCQGSSLEDYPKKEFIESILKFCLEHKNRITEVFIAEGAEGIETTDLFQNLGYTHLAETYGISLIDLNNVDTKIIENYEFSRFTEINYPSILLDSFLIPIIPLSENSETELSGSLSGMLGAFPLSHYKGWFSKTKNKIRTWPIKYSIHDILKCKMPDFTILDASSKGQILAGLPLEIDKQAAKLLGLEWKAIPHLKLINEAFPIK